MNSGKQISWQFVAVTAASLVAGMAQAQETKASAGLTRHHWRDEYRDFRPHHYASEFARHPSFRPLAQGSGVR